MIVTQMMERKECLELQRGAAEDSRPAFYSYDIAEPTSSPVRSVMCRPAISYLSLFQYCNKYLLCFKTCIVRRELME